MSVYQVETIPDTSYGGVGQDLDVQSASQSGSLPNQDSGSDKNVYNRETPPKLYARELISTVLDTTSRNILGNFTFGLTGAISVGNYVNGESGDIRISPNGIVGRNVNGETTFSIDGTTGNATFKGTLAAGSLVTGNIVIQGNGNFIVNDGTYDIILLGYQSGGF